MLYIITLFCLFIGYKIIFSKGYTALVYAFCGLLLINQNVRIVGMDIANFIYISLFLSSAYKFYIKRGSKLSYPLTKISVLILIAFVAIGTFSQGNISLSSSIIQPLKRFLFTFFICYYGYVNCEEKFLLFRMEKKLFIVFLIMTLFGIYNVIFMHNPYKDFIGSVFSLEVLDLSYIYEKSNRLRADSTVGFSFMYGYYSVILGLYFLYLLNFSGKKEIKWGILFSVIGTLICGSRTVLLCLILSYATFLTLNGKKNRFKMIFLFIGFFAVSYLTVPFVNKSVDTMLSVFQSDKSEVSGSSLEMRTMQLYGAKKYMDQNPVFGNGFYYISDVLGLGADAKVDTDMFGYESVIYVLMIEQGWIGIIVFFGFLIFYYWFIRKYRKQQQTLYAFGISIIVLFLSFSIMTGTLNSWGITMLFLGVLLKVAQLNDIEGRLIR